MTIHIIQANHVMYVGLAYLSAILSVSGILSLVHFKRRQIIKLLKKQVC